MCKSHTNYIHRAIAVAHSCLGDNRRHPFGSIIVKDHKIIGVGKESTRINNDPTAHSEIEAIRNACLNLETSSLKNCIIYTSSEPCSMCLSALYWSQIDTVYYASSREDVFNFGFSDRFNFVEKRKDFNDVHFQKMNVHQIENQKGIQLFNDWKLRDMKYQNEQF